MWRKILLGAGVAVAIGAVAALAYFQLVKQGILKYNRYDRRVEGKLRVGDQAPDLELAMYDGSTVRLSTLWEARPAFLIFGSCT